MIHLYSCTEKKTTRIIDQSYMICSCSDIDSFIDIKTIKMPLNDISNLLLLKTNLSVYS